MNTTSERRRHHLRCVFIVTGIAIVCAVLVGNFIFGSGKTGLGTSDVVVLTLGGSVTLLGLLSWDTLLGRTYVRLFAMGMSTALGIYIVEFGLTITAPSQTTNPPRFRTFVPAIADDTLGYRLTPNWEETFDDGVAKGTVRTNSLGHRDDEPTSDLANVQKVLLLGDSFTFGNLLDQSETISAKLETLSKDKINAYNMGVGGYGPPNLLESLRQADWFSGLAVVYLFYLNDLRDDARSANINTAFKGFVVPRLKPDGAPYSKNEYEQLLDKLRIQNQRPTLQFVSNWVRLHQINSKLKRFLNPEDAILGGHPDWYREENIKTAIVYTLKMRKLTQSRDSAFSVLILPSLGEAAAQRYSPYTSSFIKELKTAGVNTTELLHRLRPEHYWTHDGHLAPKGAEIVAAVLLDQLSD